MLNYNSEFRSWNVPKAMQLSPGTSLCPQLLLSFHREGTLPVLRVWSGFEDGSQSQGWHEGLDMASHLYRVDLRKQCDRKKQWPLKDP